MTSYSDREPSNPLPRLPSDYIRQHTLWTRVTFQAREDTKEWRNMRGMIMLMPKKDEERLHANFYRIFPERHGGLPVPSRELTRVALAHLKANNVMLGRKQQFEGITRFMYYLAQSSTRKEDGHEAQFFANHFAMQLDHYGRALTADDEKDLGLWTPYS